MADVLWIIKSGLPTRNGDAISADGSKNGSYVRYQPIYGGGMYESGCVVASGQAGQTDDGYLAQRFHKPSGGY